jgi:hypothetical protein
MYQKAQLMFMPLACLNLCLFIIDKITMPVQIVDSRFFAGFFVNGKF